MVRLFVAAALLLLLSACSPDGGSAPKDCADCEPVRDAVLLVTDRQGDAVHRYRSNGSYEGIFADISTCNIDRPSSVRVGPDGLVYLANFGNNQVLRLDQDGGYDRHYFSSTFLEEPVELVFRHDELFILGNDTGNIVVVGPDGRMIKELGYPKLRHGHDLALGPDGLLYVSTSINLGLDASIQVWDPDTAELVRSFAPADEMDLVTGLSFGDDDTLYATDGISGRVVRFDPYTGAIIEVIVEAGGPLDKPVSLDFGPEGLLYVVHADGVACIDPASGALIDRPIRYGDGPVMRARSLTFLD